MALTIINVKGSDLLSSASNQGHVLATEEEKLSIMGYKFIVRGD